MKTIRILCGIQCSGKSTYCEKLDYFNKRHSVVISRDYIRENYFEKPYIINNFNENRVTKIFNDELNQWLNLYSRNAEPLWTIILDNTFCKEKYIDEIISKYGNVYNIEIKFFDISLIKAHYRNIIRRFKTGKWIPIKVLNQFYRNYKKINRNKYKQYIIE